MSIPMPPRELRRIVGPTEPEAFDNPRGEPLFAPAGLPPDAYDVVFDFGCGCGRLARQLLQQKPRPRRYVGVDAHRGMVEWCQQNLSPVDPAFQFFHHNVYSPSYAPENSLRLAEPFPVEVGEVSLFIGLSVFTHLCRPQTEYYLGELERVLRPRGVAFTTWFFFDRDSFPFFPEGPFSLYRSEECFDQAVIYDRRWFLDTVRRAGLGVRSGTHQGLAGHQWAVVLEKRTPETVDRFPLGEEGAEWICGATRKPMATPTLPPERIEKAKGAPIDTDQGVSARPREPAGRPQPPALFGALAELEALRRRVSGSPGGG
ncbi:MAG TPA: class I SAM-dependent methyltransferase [Gemmataceae bacterium]|nr:class I SAM-dependent methyltransferase [Gemmataceae bacterium]